MIILKALGRVFVALVLISMVGVVVYMRYFHNPDPNDPDNYAAFIESFDISAYGEPDYVGTGQRGQDVLPLSCHAYYGLDMSRDILKGAKSVEFKLQWFDEYGCQREHYRIRNLDNGCWDTRMDRSDPGGRGGKYFSICSYTFRNIWMMPDYGGGGEDPRSFEELHAVRMQRLRSMHLSIVRHWDGSDKIVVYDLEKKCPVGYYYDIVVDSELPDYLFDTEDVYSECEI